MVSCPSFRLSISHLHLFDSVVSVTGVGWFGNFSFQVWISFFMVSIGIRMQLSLIPFFFLFFSFFIFFFVWGFLVPATVEMLEVSMIFFNFFICIILVGKACEKCDSGAKDDEIRGDLKVCGIRNPVQCYKKRQKDWWLQPRLGCFHFVVFICNEFCYAITAGGSNINQQNLPVPSAGNIIHDIKKIKNIKYL